MKRCGGVGQQTASKAMADSQQTCALQQGPEPPEALMRRLLTSNVSRLTLPKFHLASSKVVFAI